MQHMLDPVEQPLLAKRHSSVVSPIKENENPRNPSGFKLRSGLTTRQALTGFASIIDEEQRKFRTNLSWRTWVYDGLHHKSARSIFNWTEAMWIVLLIIVAFVAYGCQSRDRIFIRKEEFIALLIILVGFGVANCVLACWEARNRHLELWRQIVGILHSIRKELQSGKKWTEWKASFYPDLYSPSNPSVSLQWTYRDDALVNLPAILLVPGDIILVRPSQKVFSECVMLVEDDENAQPITLSVGDIFDPATEGEIDNPSGPVQRPSAGEARFQVREAPFRSILRESLSKKAQERPNSVVEKQRLYVMFFVIRIILPITLGVFLLANVIKIAVFTEKYQVRWMEEFFYGSLYVLLPFTPLIFPFLWLAFNYIVLAKVLTAFYNSKRKKHRDGLLHEVGLTDAMFVVKTDWASTCKRFRNFFSPSTGESLYRTSNIVHALGNVTTICCMDKKGILSWPNPGAEKILVLKSRQQSVAASKTSLRQSSSSLQEVVHSSHEQLVMKIHEKRNSLSEIPQDVVAAQEEVFGVTQSGAKEFELDFDAPDWMRSIDSLKPLGLAILLNTCNRDIEEYYSAFKDHVTCVAMHHDQTVPVVNRRCLCSLSRLMGFTDSAEQIFKYIKPIGFYRKPVKIPAELENRYKSPFPNKLSVVVKDVKSGLYQVMTQGTADIVLDGCTDYWDGQETRPLTEEDRKQILEWYTRYSMTLYCTAFSYCPVTDTIPEHASDSDSEDEDTFVELPSEDEDASLHDLTSQLSEGSTSSTKDLFETCCRNQIFIGCIAQQYQIRAEFVQFVDLLEEGCIRFVYFSSETELRSRAFAERLGLESGWNCHISLDSKGIDPTLADTDLTQPISDAAKARKRTTTQIVVEPEINLENRARLPRGIETIRDHIKDVDNVPLLVSLFTDCQPASISEMISIMQEHGEVVCCVGSSGNLTNSSIFLQADASVAIEPIYPRICMTKPPFHSSGDRRYSHIYPMELMKTLTGLNCSLSCKSDELQNLIKVIITARRNLFALRICMKYLVSSGLFLTILTSLSNAMMLPPPLSIGHILLFICFSVPMLSISLLSPPDDPNLMKYPTGKNKETDVVNGESKLRFLLTFLGLWLPSVLIILLCHILTLTQNCWDGPMLCYPFLFAVHHVESAVILSQNFCALLAAVYFVVISMSYGHYKPNFWKYSPLKKITWFLTAMIIITIQLIYFFTDVSAVQLEQKSASNSTEIRNVNLLGDVNSLSSSIRQEPLMISWTDIPFWIWLVGFLWPIVLLPLNEWIKSFQMAGLKKQQTRARQHFATKLGMNSPF